MRHSCRLCVSTAMFPALAQHHFLSLFQGAAMGTGVPAKAQLPTGPVDDALEASMREHKVRSWFCMFPNRIASHACTPRSAYGPAKISYVCSCVQSIFTLHSRGMTAWLLRCDGPTHSNSICLERLCPLCTHRICHTVPGTIASPLHFGPQGARSGSLISPNGLIWGVVGNSSREDFVPQLTV